MIALEETILLQAKDDSHAGEGTSVLRSRSTSVGSLPSSTQESSSCDLQAVTVGTAGALIDSSISRRTVSRDMSCEPGKVKLCLSSSIQPFAPPGLEDARSVVPARHSPILTTMPRCAMPSSPPSQPPMMLSAVPALPPPPSKPPALHPEQMLHFSAQQLISPPPVHPPVQLPSDSPPPPPLQAPSFQMRVQPPPASCPPAEAPVLTSAHKEEKLAPPPSHAPILRLAEAFPAPELGSAAMPTMGSEAHNSGDCKPCAFLYTKGCTNGVQCTYCHLCGPGEKKRRMKEKRRALRSVGMPDQGAHLRPSGENLEAAQI